MQHAAGTLVLLGFFFASGCCGLVYENVWVKLIGYVVGNTVTAVTIILTAFMAGLALGSWILARIGRISSPLAAYGWMELGVAFSALGLPRGLEALRPLLVSTHGTPAGWLVEFGSLQLLVLVPTILMGGTLPMLCAYARSRFQGTGRTLGVLYAVNNAGAVFGGLVSGFHMIQTYGLDASSALAAYANAAIGIAAIVWARAAGDGPSGSGSEPVRPDGQGALDRRIVTVVFASGFAAMLYEVALMKLLPLVLSSSIHAFAVMVASFIAGISVGSAAAGLLSPGIERPERALGLLQLAVGALFLGSLALYDTLPLVFLHLRLSLAPSFGGFWLLVFGLCVVISVPTVFIGATLPVAAEIVGRSGTTVARTVGQLYGANTAGNILGTIVTGLVLLPRMGFQRTVELGVAVNVISGIGYLACHGRISRAAAAGFLAACVGCACLMPQLDLFALTSGVYRLRTLPAQGERRFVDVLKTGRELLSMEEDETGFVSVERLPGTDHRALSVNGKVDASTTGDMLTQKLLAHAPLLVHPKPRTALVIGLGAGVTAATALVHGLDSVTTVEISPAVIRAGRFFADVNRNLLQDPRHRMVTDDARGFLASTTQRYDAVISEPSNPWIAGIGNLYTREFFQVVRDRLAPGGVVCQWIHVYEMDEATFRMILRTFRTVFPTAYVLGSSPGDRLLIGATAGLEFDLDTILRNVGRPGVKADLESVGLRSAPLLAGHFLVSSEDLERYIGAGPINCDDWPILEYRAPRALFSDAHVPPFDPDVSVGSPRHPVRRLIERRAMTADEVVDFCVHFERIYPVAMLATMVREAIAVSPAHVGLHTLLARYLEAAGERLSALVAAREAARLAPKGLEQVQLLYRIARSVETDHFSFATVRRYDETLAAARLWMTLAPDDPVARAEAARFQLMIDRARSP